MLDVHPPHSPTHTWRDFFIHIATIVVGLLIAVGLEQTVEYIHHRIERGELMEDLRAEAERNLKISDYNLDSMSLLRQWSGAAYDRLVEVKPGQPLLLPAFPKWDEKLEKDITWRSGLSSGAVNYLDPEVRDHYSILYQFYASVWDQSSGWAHRFLSAHYNLDTVLGPAVFGTDGRMDLTAWDGEQRRRVLDAIIAFRTAALGQMRQTAWLEAYSYEATMTGLRSRDNVPKRYAEILAAHPEMTTRLLRAQPPNL